MSPPQQGNTHNFRRVLQDFLRKSSSSVARPRRRRSARSVRRWQQFVTMWTACWTRLSSLSPDTIHDLTDVVMDQLENYCKLCQGDGVRTRSPHAKAIF